MPRQHFLRDLAGLALAAMLAACSAEPEPAAQPRPAVIDPAADPAADPVGGVPTPAAADVEAMPDVPLPPDDVATPAAAEAVVRDYYAAINARDFARAHAYWSDEGAASGQTLEAFAAGYANTRQVQAKVGKATAEEGAAGSRYILVPVEVKAVQQDGSTPVYRGFFILRAVVADGASVEQRRWHLSAAELQRSDD